MNEEILPEDLVLTLQAFCQKYTDEVCEEVEKGLEKIGKETLSEVKELSPVYEGKSKKLKKGAYKKSWVLSTTKERGKIQFTVHNKKYHLVHLLEKGHLLKDGTGRVYGEVPAKKHVETAEAHAEEKVDALLEGL